MQNIPPLHLEDYSYFLPEDKIAQYPAHPRDHSKLLVYQNGVIQEDRFYHLVKYLPAKSFLVFNDTKVLPARLFFHRSTGAKIEILLLEPHGLSYEQAFQETSSVQWKCFMKRAKRWKPNEVLEACVQDTVLRAKWAHKASDGSIIEFEWNNGKTFYEILREFGRLPLPPYMNREAEACDEEYYQTIYAKHLGAVAAPTAGLHFSPQVFQSMQAQNIEWAEITLHVGAGTFKPITSPDILQHPMHQELCCVSLKTLKDLLNAYGRLIAVGTTSLRVLESLYWFVVNDFKPFGQWFPYQAQPSLSYPQALAQLIAFLEQQACPQIAFPTSLFILPGYTIQSIRGIITNFHQPRSTLLLLIAAWVGKDWKKLYEYALNHDFRFLSYGDSSLLLK